MARIRNEGSLYDVIRYLPRDYELFALSWAIPVTSTRKRTTTPLICWRSVLLRCAVKV